RPAANHIHVELVERGWSFGTLHVHAPPSPSPCRPPMTPRSVVLLALFLSVTSPLVAQQPGQTDISLASNGLDFLTAFAEGNRPSLESANVAIIRFDGDALGPTQNLVQFTTPQFALSQQSVAFAGNVYMNAMEELLAVSLRRITATGVVIDKTPIVIDT